MTVRKRSRPGTAPPAKLNGWRLSLRIGSTWKHYVFIRPDAAAELLLRFGASMPTEPTIPEPHEVERVNGHRAIGEPGVWRLKAVEVDAEDFYAHHASGL